MTRAIRRALLVLQFALLVVAGALLGYCLASYIGMKVFQVREARRFEQELHNRRPSAKPVPPTARRVEPPEGTVEGRLEIPRLGLRVMVIEGANDDDLSRAAGHIPGTALPGEPGNVGIAAHRDTFFRPLRGIRLNDEIALETPQGVSRYRVVSTRIVRPADTQVLNPDGHDTLTLVTCYPFHYIGHAPKRFIVRAERADHLSARRAG
ncbi:MAG TPA: class D sortase [Bryobacteraceae bacterium]|jgi:sortase A|nr:class D sortase [Bryobacteraceae bacterium]